MKYQNLNTNFFEEFFVLCCNIYLPSKKIFFCDVRSVETITLLQYPDTSPTGFKEVFSIQENLNKISQKKFI